MTLLSFSRWHRHFETQSLIEKSLCAHYLLNQWLEFDQTSTDTSIEWGEKWLDFGDLDLISRSLHYKMSLVFNERGVSNKHCLLPFFISFFCRIREVQIGELVKRICHLSAARRQIGRKTAVFWSVKNWIWSGKSQWKVREFSFCMRVATLPRSDILFPYQPHIKFWKKKKNNNNKINKTSYLPSLFWNSM